VADVCAITFRSGLPYCPRELVERGVHPGAVPAALAAWLRALQQGDALRALLLRLRDALLQRVGGSEGGGAGLEGGMAGLEGGRARECVPGEVEGAEVLEVGRAMVEAVEELVSRGCWLGGGGEEVGSW